MIPNVSALDQPASGQFTLDARLPAVVERVRPIQVRVSKTSADESQQALARAGCGKNSLWVWIGQGRHEGQAIVVRSNQIRSLAESRLLNRIEADLGVEDEWHHVDRKASADDGFVVDLVGGADSRLEIVRVRVIEP